MGCGTKCPLSHLEEVFLIGRRRCVNPQIAKHPRLLKTLQGEPCRAGGAPAAAFCRGDASAAGLARGALK